MAKEPLTTRLDADTKQEVENYADDHEIGQTEAARRLIRAGLAAEGRPVAASDGGTESVLERFAAPSTVFLGSLLVVLSIGLIGVSGLYIETSLFVAMFTAAIGTVTMVVGAVVIWTAALAQLALARPLRALVLPDRTGETT